MNKTKNIKAQIPWEELDAWIAEIQFDREERHGLRQADEERQAA